MVNRYLFIGWKLISGPVIFLLFICFASCGTDERMQKPEVSEIKDLYDVEVNLPDSVGAELFRANCITCHSLRYIQNQPDFSVKTWEKIVDKMRKSFGAPLSDSAAAVIVDYLVAVKGVRKGEQSIK